MDTANKAEVASDGTCRSTSTARCRCPCRLLVGIAERSSAYARRHRTKLRARSHMHWGFASATRFGGSEPGVAPAKPSVYGHTCKQGTTPTLAESESKVDCGTYGTENRRGRHRSRLSSTHFCCMDIIRIQISRSKSIYHTADRGVFR